MESEYSSDFVSRTMASSMLVKGGMTLANLFRSSSSSVLEEEEEEEEEGNEERLEEAFPIVIIDS